MLALFLKVCLNAESNTENTLEKCMVAGYKFENVDSRVREAKSNYRNQIVILF